MNYSSYSTALLCALSVIAWGLSGGQMHLFHKWGLAFQSHIDWRQEDGTIDKRVGALGYECSVCKKRKVEFQRGGKDTVGVVQAAINWLNQREDNNAQN